MKYYLAPDLALDSATYSQLQKNKVLVPGLTIIDHTIIFTQETLHSSFNSKKKKKKNFPLDKLLETSTFYMSAIVHSG